MLGVVSVHQIHKQQALIIKDIFLKPKQHFFRPVKSGDFGLINGLESYGKDSTSWEILSGSNPISASTSGGIGDGFAYGFFDLTGVFNPYVFPNHNFKMMVH